MIQVNECHDSHYCHILPPHHYNLNRIMAVLIIDIVFLLLLCGYINNSSSTKYTKLDLFKLCMCKVRLEVAVIFYLEYFKGFGCILGVILNLIFQ